MSDRPRRSARSSAYASPAHTPGPSSSNHHHHHHQQQQQQPHPDLSNHNAYHHHHQQLHLQPLNRPSSSSSSSPSSSHQLNSSLAQPHPSRLIPNNSPSLSTASPAMSHYHPHQQPPLHLVNPFPANAVNSPTMTLPTQLLPPSHLAANPFLPHHQPTLPSPFPPHHLQHQQNQPPQPPQPQPQPYPNAWTMGRSSAPIPPFTPLTPPNILAAAQIHHQNQPPPPVVHPLPQAYFTTFPSRMRVGTTTLMQPVSSPDLLLDPFGRNLDSSSGTPLAGGIETPQSNRPSDHRHFGSRARTSTRRAAAAGLIRYTEADDSAEEFEEQDSRLGSEDETIRRGSKRKAAALASPPRGRSTSGLATPADAYEAGRGATPSLVNGGGTGDGQGQAGQMQVEEEKFKSLLGLPPPGNKVVARRAIRTAHTYHPEEEMVKHAARGEVLVPIRIELETETHRIKDVFTWNMNEKLTTPYHFARLLLADLDLPVEPYATQIQNAILQQVEDATGTADLEIEPAAGGIWSAATRLRNDEREKDEYEEEEEATKESRQWDWGLRETKDHQEFRTRMAKRLKTGKGLGDFEDDLRVIVDYEVQILRHNLRDRLEWDLNSPLTPEAFAQQLCKDLGLTGEAVNLVANALREQLINHKRAAIDLGLMGTGKVLREKEEEIKICEVLIAEEKKRRKREREAREKEKEEREKERSRIAALGLEAPPTEESRPLTPAIAAASTPLDSAAAAIASPTDSKANNDNKATAESGLETTGAAETPGPGSLLEADQQGQGPKQAGLLEVKFDQAPDSSSTPVGAAGLSGTSTPRTSIRLSRMSMSNRSKPGSPSPAPGRTGGGQANSSVTTPSLQQPPPHPLDLAAKLQGTTNLSARLHSCHQTIREILTRGPRPLEGVWRDYHESREFGPLLEMLTDEDLEKMEEANVRASRRNRRDALRAGTASRYGRRR
ncbi:SNF5-domain-containing protein [Violaceomyces palustris]|uniref:SNF5-domain-containing protein n=1 Tax=Violaceomyces palustris TaxID=1673888 RepID=A0ACD0NT08_9BASI|nr:SNF5-domain-containing protein [Violaceomyces palustris]